MQYVGIDYHKRYSMITKMDGRGKILEQVRLENNPKTLTKYLDNLHPKTKITLEATGNWYSFYELIEDKHIGVQLAHPLKTRAIAEARIKTDKIDSTILAQLLRTGFLPTFYIPPREIRDIRETLRYRASLVSLRTAIKCKVHAILSKNGLNPSFSDLFGKGGTKYLKSIELRPCYREALDGYLRLLEVLNDLIKQVSVTIKAHVDKSPQAILLTSMPGISYYSALLILSEIGDIRRFPSARHLCSYGGLIPSVFSSGGKTRYGHITKQGSRWMRWILVELSHHAANGSVRFQKMYLRVARRHGKNTARVAVAREMLKVIYYMLKNNEPFRDRVSINKKKSG